MTPDESLLRAFVEKVAHYSHDGWLATEAHYWLDRFKDQRCPSVRYKASHDFSRTNPERTRKPSSWRCILPAGHPGQHQAAPSAHQAPWGP